MKNILISIIFLALIIFPVCAQTNLFTVPVTNAVITPAQPAVVVTQPSIRLVVIDAQAQRLTIFFVNNAKPIVIQGAAFQALKASFQGQFAAAIAAYLQQSSTGTATGTTTSTGS